MKAHLAAGAGRVPGHVLGWARIEGEPTAPVQPRASRRAHSVQAARRTRTPAVDTACAEAVDLAREAAEETARPLGVGEHLGLRADADRVVTHYFESLDPGYRGWRWAVTVTRASRAKNVTVSECVLLPGDELLAPQWVPWLERLRPGDLGPGDLLPTAPDDVRLAPGFTQVDDSTDREAQWELGLGRVRCCPGRAATRPRPAGTRASPGRAPHRRVRARPVLHLRLLRRPGGRAAAGLRCLRQRVRAR